MLIYKQLLSVVYWIKLLRNIKHFLFSNITPATNNYKMYFLASHSACCQSTNNYIRFQCDKLINIKMASSKCILLVNICYKISLFVVVIIIIITIIIVNNNSNNNNNNNNEERGRHPICFFLFPQREVKSN